MAMFSVTEFCHSHGISRAMFYKLAKEGRAPKTVKVGRRTLVSADAAAQWRRNLEKEAV
jgi:predicted DNA-binding transcriptional regulator AlpA